ncbi:hypothetical protein ES731_11660 [Psychroflexus gondwanensis]|jgi:hypothetical protein|uniref:Uncharacterized protein n=1 Tax=Psychroflexus gondwanensis ACAM 44 TaxID=1189619 RepID=N1WT08_9FLAO|nr:hypothetical protein [Psychroflexus gondwanensis]EMY80279.1 hypothetical protein pgond44_12657 [Psychroflexus gondwanensis ACAM 44]TXE17716.1 hypothetical protein ES731_11660 [Psychroflexus gondwanensis]
MEIKYSKKRLNQNLYFGILWLVLGSAAAVFTEAANIFNYGYLSLGILYIATYLFEKHKKYLTITDAIISKNNVFPKTIHLSEIKRIKKIGADYIVEAETTKLKIDTDWIDENSLSELKTFLDHLSLKKD